jgi:CRP/FNR family cyclic AMP-dependent transcriptional regulator
MISTELLRRYPFFSGLSHKQLVEVAKTGEEVTVEAGQYFFHEGEELKAFYLVLDGEVDIVMGITDQSVNHSFASQLEGKVKKNDVTTSTIVAGDFFGWSGLIPPHQSTAGAKATQTSRVVIFDCTELLKTFSNDCNLGYLMTQKVAQVIRQRLRDLRMELLASIEEKA